MDCQTVCYERQRKLACGLADKCNKDQLKKYPPEDGLIKEAETCRGELMKVVA
jgi:hypothetical protein